ncbi:MAG: hypothetical protein H8E37_03095 [Planctomycetes bacterium]|nr:hypothetical protein [Planctomycetota bacterium]
MPRDEEMVVLNVGWLDKEVPFPNGSVTNEFRFKLAQFCRTPIRLCRGFHVCQFCSEQMRLVTGNGEIWVRGPDGTLYAAPKMILHYVNEHEYLAPRQFIEAVEFSEPPILEIDTETRE